MTIIFYTINLYSYLITAIYFGSSALLQYHIALNDLNHLTEKWRSRFL